MVLTDGVNANYSNVVMKYNHLFDGSNIPVRIFTYLIGKEVTNVEEIKWMACANRGLDLVDTILLKLVSLLFEFQDFTRMCKR